MMDRDVLKINTLFLRDAKRYCGVSLAKHVQPCAGLKCSRNPVKTILRGSISGLRDQKVSEQSADAVGKAWYSSSPGPCWILGLISPCVRETSSPEQGSVNLQAGSGSCVGVRGGIMRLLQPHHPCGLLYLRTFCPLTLFATHCIVQWWLCMWVFVLL